jgi:hypothetical protein
MLIRVEIDTRTVSRSGSGEKKRKKLKAFLGVYSVQLPVGEAVMQ